MASQLLRSPCSTPTHSSTKVGAPTFFHAQAFRVQKTRLPSLALRVRHSQPRPCSSTSASNRPEAEAEKIQQHPESQSKNVSHVLRLVARVLPVVLPVVLLRAAPALATTIHTAAPAARFRVPELAASAWTGFMAGCLHTLTGPDHLAALAPLSIGRSRAEGALVGALWGCGHDAGQIIFGLLFLILKDKLHIDLVRTWSARVVGVTLVAIGALGIKEAQEAPVPCIAGDAGCEADYGTTSNTSSDRKKPFGLATFGTGVVHGLQPDALLVILPALALPSRLAGVSFLLMFLVGTVVAMASYTAFVGSCSELLRERVPWMTQRLSLGSSLIAIIVGLLVLAGEVFGINLF